MEESERVVALEEVLVEALARVVGEALVVAEASEKVAASVVVSEKAVALVVDLVKAEALVVESVGDLAKVEELEEAPEVGSVVDLEVAAAEVEVEVVEELDITELHVA